MIYENQPVLKPVYLNHAIRKSFHDELIYIQKSFYEKVLSFHRKMHINLFKYQCLQIKPGDFLYNNIHLFQEIIYIYIKRLCIEDFS